MLYSGDQIMSKRITAVVVTWNSEKLLPSLARTAEAIKPLCDIVISDNASTDSTVELAQQLIPGALILRNPLNAGFGYGNNRGIDICGTEYLLLLNSDASISLASLEILLDSLDSNTDIAGVQPLIRLWDWPLVTLSTGAAMNDYGRCYDMDFMHFQPFPDESSRNIPCVTAALSLFRTDALRKVNGFDENIFMYFEDIDLCLRLREAGYGFLLEPSSTAQHRMGSSSTRQQAERWENLVIAISNRKYLGGDECKLTDHWKFAEYKARVSSMLRFRPWLWRLRVVRQIRRMKMEHVRLPEDFLMRLISPRPLRMPNPRPFSSDAELSEGSGIIKGPGWIDMRIDTCGFGCLKVPVPEGMLTLTVGSCNIPGSAALWSEEGCLARVLLCAGEKRQLKAEIGAGISELYLVPDRFEQIIELENAEYSFS